MSSPPAAFQGISTMNPQHPSFLQPNQVFPNLSPPLKFAGSRRAQHGFPELHHF